jgi:hypothetical protein
MKLRKLSVECQYGLLKKLSIFFMSDLTGEKVGLVGGCHGTICGYKKARSRRAYSFYISSDNRRASDDVKSYSAI